MMPYDNFGSLPSVGGEALIDSGADRCVLGPEFLVESYSNRTSSVHGLADNPVMQNHPVGIGLGAIRTINNIIIIIRICEAVLECPVSVLSVNQMRSYGVEVNDVPRRYGGSQCLVLSESQIIQLKYLRAMIYLKVRTPTREELRSCRIVTITSPNQGRPLVDESNDDLNFLYEEHDI